MHLVFLTPLGALLALGALLPLGALALNERRARRARRSLGVEAPRYQSYAGTLAALALVPALLGLAVAQPVLQSERTIRVRADAQAFYVFDTSESMDAASGPRRPTRLARALTAARRMHFALREVPSGVATMTDRVLPNVFPTGSEQVFTAALADTVGIERPPPKGFNEVATTFASLDTFAGNNFFSDGVTHRLVILFTDGETAPYFVGDLHEALRPAPHTSFVIVRLGGGSERIFVHGKPDRAYRRIPSRRTRRPHSPPPSVVAPTRKGMSEEQSRVRARSWATARWSASARACTSSPSPAGSFWPRSCRWASFSGGATSSDDFSRPLPAVVDYHRGRQELLHEQA